MVVGQSIESASCVSRERARATVRGSRIASRAGDSQNLFELRRVLDRLLFDGVERLERQDELTVKFDPHGPFARWRPDVEKCATNREAAGVLDHRNPQVARLGERANERVAVDLRLSDDSIGAPRELSLRNDFAYKSRRRDDEHAPRPVLREVEQRRHSAHRGTAVRADLGVRRGFVRGEDDHVAFARLLRVLVERASREESDVVRRAARKVDVLCHENDAASLTDKGRDDRSSRATVYARDIEPLPRGPADPSEHVPDARRDDALGWQE